MLYVPTLTKLNFEIIFLFVLSTEDQSVFMLIRKLHRGYWGIVIIVRPSQKRLILRWARYGYHSPLKTHPPKSSRTARPCVATSALPLVGSGGSVIQRISDTAAMASIPLRIMADGWFVGGYRVVYVVCLTCKVKLVHGRCTVALCVDAN